MRSVFQIGIQVGLVAKFNMVQTKLFMPLIICKIACTLCLFERHASPSFTLWIVLSVAFYFQGSCQVLKKLKGVTAKCVSKRKKDDDLNLPPKTKCIVFGRLVLKLPFCVKNIWDDNVTLALIVDKNEWPFHIDCQ